MHKLLTRTRYIGFVGLNWLCVFLIMIPFGWLVTDVFVGGAAHLSWRFIVDLPEHSGRSGGIRSILASTLFIVAIAIGVAVPLGTAVAVWLNEFAYTSPMLGKLTNVSLDALAGMPSIVCGLFGSAFFCNFLGLGFSILAGGLTLACMVLPIYIRSVERGLAKVPDEWRLGAAALGISKGTALVRLLLPAAAPAIKVGLLLGVGRAVAESAALIFTSGYVDRMPESAMDSGRSLAVHIYDLSMNVAGGDSAACASALVLMAVLLVIHFVSDFFSDRLLSLRMNVQ